MKPPKQDFSGSINQVDADERLLAIIKKHPFGIIKVYAQSAIGIVGAVALISFVLPGLTGLNDSANMYAILVTGVLIVAAIMIVILMIATVIYYQSNIRVTNKTITQTLQLSLFAKKTSQLSVTSIEDVTSNRSGFFPTMFNYGRLIIETAGEQENFHFDYCPHPDHYAKLILDTRQQFLGRRDESVLHPTYRSTADDVPADTNDSNQAGQQQTPPAEQLPPALPSDEDQMNRHSGEY